MIAPVGRRRTFAELRRRGRRVRHGPVRMNHLAMETPVPQVAFAIGRSFGNAVERNRGRRRLRAAFVEALGQRSIDEGSIDEVGGAFLLTGSRRLLTDPYAGLVGSVNACLDQLATEPQQR